MFVQKYLFVLWIRIPWVVEYGYGFNYEGSLYIEIDLDALVN